MLSFAKNPNADLHYYYERTGHKTTHNEICEWMENCYTGLVEAICCKNGSDAGGYNERFYQVTPQEIDFSPLTWEKVDAAKDLLYAVVRHYLIVLKDGVIPPQYLKEERHG